MASSKDFIQDFIDTFPGASARLEKVLGSKVLEKRVVHNSVSTRTGAVSLDIALGGGLPTGIVEVFGDESSGKTAFVGQCIAEHQQKGHPACLVASEGLDVPYLDALGVDTSKLPVVLGGDPDHRDHMLSFLKMNQRGLLVIDSITALRPEFEEPGEWNRKTLTLFHDFRAHTPPGTCVLVVSQVRARRSIDPKKAFAGGTDSASRRLADLCAARLALSRMNVQDDGLDYVLLVDIVSNVLARPSCLVELPAKKGQGVDQNRDLVRAAVAAGLIEKRGSHYYFDRVVRLGQGEENAAMALRGDIREALIMDILGE